MRHKAADFDGGVMYFSIDYEDYNVQEDADRGDPEAQRMMNDGKFAHQKEMAAAEEIGDMLSVRVYDEGHTSHGDLTCKFRINTMAELRRVVEEITSNAYDSEGHIELGRYFRTSQWSFYPEGVNGPEYALADSRADGYLADFLEQSRTSNRCSRCRSKQANRRILYEIVDEQKIGELLRELDGPLREKFMDVLGELQDRLALDKDTEMALNRFENVLDSRAPMASKANQIQKAADHLGLGFHL